MEFLSDLWLPIVLSAVAVFVVSSLFHMLLPIHKSDYQKLPNEDGMLAGMRDKGLTPGTYMFPCASSMKDMGTPEMIAKYEKGPVGWMQVLPNGPYNMGKSLVQWFLFSILISVFVAYLGSLGLTGEQSFRSVFRFASTVAVLGYAGAELTDSIWKGRSWGVTAKFVFDGLAYGLATGAVFGWMWPEAA